MYIINIAKSGKSLSVDFNSLPEVSKQFIIEYGLRQKLNDAGSSATVKELGAIEAGNQAFALAEASLAALIAGDVSRGAGKAGMTLEERITQRVIRATFKAVCKRPVSKEPSADNDSLLAAIGQVYGKPADVILKALQKKIDAEIELARNKPAGIALDFSELE